jgi:protein-L-isoaspartate(D-aspartate) O-methyltransferase
VKALSYETLCEEMIRVIELEVDYTRDYIGRDHLAKHVMQAMREVPRHEFVPEMSRDLAYANGPIPIGYGQTISQPYIVALMTDLLEPEAGHVILEVGTGSGYQAAVLSRLVKQVYSMEDVEPLVEPAQERLRQLGYQNVEVRHGDGYFGWPEHAPYDGIIVTCGAPHVPQPLVEQLKPGGKLVIPVGHELFGQVLLLVEKQPNGDVVQKKVLDVAFVPLTGSAHDHPADIHPWLE